MNSFIEKNQETLLTYCIVARIIGCLFVVSGCINGIGATVVMFTKLDQYPDFQVFFNAMPIKELNNVFIGLFAFWFAQFMRFLFDAEYRQGWLIHNTDKLLYKYATIVLGYNFITIVAINGFGFERFGEIIGRLIIFILFGWIWPIVFVGLGFILKRIIPVIEESKTLV